MTRPSDDSWDLTTGVGSTATMVAAARAIASRSPEPLINDPFAEVLVREVGLKLFTQIVDGVVDFRDIGAGWVPSYFGIRTRAFDDFATGACSLGTRQAVILASGLDSRAYRMDWPADMVIYEIDQPAVVDWKQHTMAKLGVTSTAQHHSIGIDLRQDWPAALRQAGFHDSKPTAWIVEGLLVGYLPPAAQDAILDAITALSAPSSLIAADHVDVRHPEVLNNVLNRLHDVWSKLDADMQLRDLAFAGVRHDPAEYLAERGGWSTRNKTLDDLIRAAGRPAPEPGYFPADSEYMLFLNGIRS